MSGIIGQGTKSGIVGLPTIENSISDYETGTWTGTNTNVTELSAITNEGYYKIGRMVYVYCLVTASNNNSNHGVSTMGLPFAASDEDKGGGAGNYFMGHMRAGAGNYDIRLQLYKNGTSISWRKEDGTGNRDLLAKNIVAGTYEITMWYPTDD